MDWKRGRRTGKIGASSLNYLKLLIDAAIIQVSEIQDTTQIDLQEIASTGTLKAGEKVLADLRKRKLISQKYALYLYLANS